MMKIVNLTPHDIVVKNGSEEIIFKPSGVVSRVATQYEPAGEINNIPVNRRTFGDIEGLPEEQPGTIFIVSGVVLTAAINQGRKDCVAPDTTNAIRDDQGRIVAVTGFVTE